MTIDCTTNEPAYYTALSFHREPIPLFLLAPNGQKLTQEGQTFTITSLTQQDAGDYGCLVKDKSLQNSTISKAELVIISRKYCRNSFYHISCCSTTVVPTAPKSDGQEKFIMILYIYNLYEF